MAKNAYVRRNRLSSKEIHLEPKVMLAGATDAEAIMALDAEAIQGNAKSPAALVSSPSLEENADPVASGTTSSDVLSPNTVPVPAGGSVQFPNERIRAENNATIPASTVEARDSSGQLLTGEGAGVGIISDSFNLLGGFQADVESGDLPAGVDIIAEGPAGVDEGRAIAQLVYDIAPDANLAFQASVPNASIINSSQITENQQSQIELIRNNTARLGISDFAQGVAYQQLIQSGDIDIIVDDVTSPVAPVYQLGFKALVQEQAVAEGISVFSGAGNDGDDAVEVEFNGEAGDYVDFDPETPGIQGLPVSYGADSRAPRVALFWDDPYKSIDRDAEVTADFDLVFLGNDSFIDNENPENNVLTSPMLNLAQVDGALAGSQRVQIDETGAQTGSDPWEFYDAPLDVPLEPGETIDGQWFARLNRGAGENRLVRAVFKDGNPPAQANDSTLIVAGPNANAVGAVNSLNNNTQPFSSRGESVILFDSSGERLPQPSQANVTFLSPDNINTTFFGNNDTDGDGRPNFEGTSAAAGSAGGVAALLKQLDPLATPAEITDYLSLNADFRGDGTFSGTGLINAQASVDELESFLADPELVEQRDDRLAQTARERQEAKQRAQGDLRRGSEVNRPDAGVFVFLDPTTGAETVVSERDPEGSFRRIDRVFRASEGEQGGQQSRQQRA